MDRSDISQSVMTQIINNIKVSDMTSGVKILANEKLKTSCPEKHSYSIYRDLLFLSFISLGRENIDQGMLTFSLGDDVNYYNI